MKRKVLTTALLLACAFALSAPLATRPAFAQATTITDNQTVPIDFIATACNGETVAISGTSHVVVHATTTPDGHITFKTHIQFQLSGTSASGITYNANETVDSTEITNSGGAQVLTSVGQLHLISQGSTDNLVVRTTIHVTVNANGQITSTSFEFTTDCNG